MRYAASAAYAVASGLETGAHFCLGHRKSVEKKSTRIKFPGLLDSHQNQKNTMPNAGRRRASDGATDVVTLAVTKCLRMADHPKCTVTSMPTSVVTKLNDNGNARVREALLQHAGKMMWSVASGMKTTCPKLDGSVSEHASGKCPAFFQEFLQWNLPNSDSQYLLSMCAHQNMELHIDPSRDANISKRSHTKRKFAIAEVRHMFDNVSISCFDITSGDLAVFLGSRLHGVLNIGHSFSFGMHYMCDNDDDELVVYGMLSGNKKVILIDCGDRELEAFISALGVLPTQDMFENNGKLALLAAIEERMHRAHAVEC